VSFFRTLRYEIDPPHLQPALISGNTITIDTSDLAVSATRELSQTSPVLMGLGAAIRDLLVPGDTEWRWRDTGPGVGREVRRSISGLFGRFIARWYLETHHGAGAFVPIDRDTFTFHVPSMTAWFRVKRRPGTAADLPDWVWAAPPAAPGAPPTGGFLEAKGTYYRNQLLRSLAGAQTQLSQLTIEHGTAPAGPWITLQTKGWAVATGWATARPMKRGFPAPILRVEDPVERGEMWTQEHSAAFFDGLRRLQMAQSLAGLGSQRRARQILDRRGRPDIPIPSDSGQRPGIWRVRAGGLGTRTIIGVEVRSLAGDADAPSMVAGIDEEAAERAAEDQPGLADMWAPERAEFMLVRRREAERVRDEVQD
jgi:hypothetical protein